MIYKGHYIEELIHVWNVYANYDAWRNMEPILHTAPSLGEAQQWVDRQVELTRATEKYIPPEEKYRLVKRTKRDSLVVIERRGDKAVLEIANMEDMLDITGLLDASWIKWDMEAGISKGAWEGTPAHLRSPRGISKGYPGYTIRFDFSDLEKVMEGRILQPLMLEREGGSSSTSPTTYPSRKGIIPKLPEEARGDFLFYEYIRDLCKYEALSEEDARRLWEGYHG